jgi:hypothetical protein
MVQRSGGWLFIDVLEHKNALNHGMLTFCDYCRSHVLAQHI